MGNVRTGSREPRRVYTWQPYSRVRRPVAGCPKRDIGRRVALGARHSRAPGGQSTAKGAGSGEGDYPIKRSLGALTRRLRTTPGQMRFASATTALMTGVVGIAAITVLHTRHDATQAIASVAQPSLVQASKAYASFSDADATASDGFLTGDTYLVHGRNRYVADLSTATAELAAISRTARATLRSSAASWLSTRTFRPTPGS